jgi:uncharacterized protein (TIGR02246 family)
MVAALLVSACAAAPPPATQGTADDEVAIRGMAAKYAASFNANDVAALAQMVTDDFESVAADGMHTKGRAAFQEAEDKSTKDRQAAGLNLTLSTSNGYLNWIDPTHAVIGGTYAMAGLPPGAPDKGAWIVVVEKAANGQWLMANSLVAESMPPPPPPPPAKGK